ncbi:MAG: ParA family protein [Butyrivibrio sp.]|nr:ParA family protein [Butyrivibrio sp.]
MAKTIIFGNQKGGVAKTTSTYNVSTQLALKGYRVLMVDSDPQASLTIIAGKIPEDYLENNLTALLYDQDGRLDIHDCIISLDNILPKNTEGTLSLLPCDIAMASGDLEFVSRPRNSELLSRVLSKVDDEFDYICIDCLPSLGMISINDISASDYIVGCVETSYQAYRGIGYYTQVIDRLIKANDFDTQFIGIIITKTTRSNDSRDLIEVMKKEYNVFGEIPNSVEVTKGEFDGIPVSVRRPGHISSVEYSNITDKIIEVTDVQ